MKSKDENLKNIILAKIKENPKITQNDLSNLTAYSDRTIRRYIKDLKDDNKLSRRKKGKKCYWELID